MRSRLGKTRAVALIALMALSATGCTDAYRQAQKKDTLEAWKAFLTSGEGDFETLEAARARVDDLSFEDAARLATVASFKRYLQLYPTGRHQAEARAGLARLRFEAVAKDGSTFALEDYLAEHGDSPAADDARKLLRERRREAALAEGTVEALTSWLARYPEGEDTAPVVRALDDLAFERARAGATVSAWETYRERFPEGAHREAARAAIRALDVVAAVRTGRMDEADAIVLSTGDPEVQETLIATLSREVTRDARRRFDTETLALVGAEDETSQAVAAHSDREAWAEAAATLSQSLAPDAPLLEGARTDEDARRRFIAVRAMGYSGDPIHVPLLLEALGDKNLLVAREAMTAFDRLTASLDPVVRDVTLTRTMGSLGETAAAPGRRLAMALVEKAAGRPHALDTLRAAASDRTFILASLRLSELDPEPTQRWVQLAAVVRALRDEGQARLPALEDARGARRLDRPLLRQGRALLVLLGETLPRATALAEARDESPAWLEDARALQRRLQIVLPDVLARARTLRRGLVAMGIDEFSVRRRDVGRAQEKALRELLPAAKVAPAWVALSLELAARSPHEAVSKAAQAARSTLTPKEESAAR